MPNLQDLLSEVPAGVQKFAAIESPDRQQVEQDFGRLAFAFLRDRAPQLLEYLVGFEVVDQEPDGSKVVGIFGFNINGAYWYVPAFFMQNQIKGMDLLYAMDEKSFYPLQEGWINFILSKQAVELGSRADPSVRADLENPNFSFISSPPTGIKRACEEYRRVWNQLQHELVEAMDKDAEFQEALAGALAKTAGKHLDVEPKDRTVLIDFLKQAGGPNAVYRLLNTFEDEGFMKAACTFYDYHDLMVDNFSEALAPKVAEFNVRVVTKQEVCTSKPTLTSQEKLRVVRDGFTLVDKREENELTEVYNVDYMTSIGNPDVPGTYSVILRGGAVVPLCILSRPFRSQYPSNVTVIDKKSGAFFDTPAKCIFVQFDANNTSDPRVAKDNIYADSGQIGDMEIGENYVLVNEKLTSSMPFTVKGITQEGDDLVRINIRWLYCPLNYPSVSGAVYRDDLSDSTSGFSTWSDSCLLPTDRTGKLKKTGDDLVVPTRSFKVFKLSSENTSNDNSGSTTIIPASQADIYEEMQKAGAHNLRIDSDLTGEFSIMLNGIVDQQQLGYKSASVRLVCGYGLTPDSAEELLKEASTKYKSTRLIKLAQVAMPNPPPPSMGYDPVTQQQIEVPYDETVQGETYGLPPMGQDHGAGSGFNLGSQEARQLGQLPTDVNTLAQEAAATGQQQVFDNGIIGSLAGTYDVSFAIDSFLPEMTKSLDRIGRILFLFYWKNEEFAERYGDQDITAMEDQLRAVFKSYGDLVLKLQQKTIGAEESNFIEG